MLAQDTPLVLLDEPTTALDIGQQERVMRTLVAVAAAGGKAVVAAFHDINLAASYADRMVVMDGGIVRAAGRPEEVLQAALLDVCRQRMLVGRHPTRGTPLVIAVD